MANNEVGRVALGLELSSKSLDQQMGSMQSKLENKFAAIGRVAGAAFAAVFAIKGVTAAVEKIAKLGDTIDKTSQKLGMSAKAYQEWDFVMTHAGASIESMTTSMKTLASAAATNNAAFAELGLTQEKIAGLSQEELFRETIAALQKVTDKTERTYLAGRLLGRGATELGALLNMSAEETDAMRRRVGELPDRPQQRFHAQG